MTKKIDDHDLDLPEDDEDKKDDQDSQDVEDTTDLDDGEESNLSDETKDEDSLDSENKDNGEQTAESTDSNDSDEEVDVQDSAPRLIVSNVEDIMGDRFGRYAKYIIQDRALPDVRDGLKPVQRRILFAMHTLGLTPDKPPKKSARVVGEVIGKYHPHGDTSVYEALVRMSQWWKLGSPLIDMQGNNGSIDGDSAAAMRYTEVRLAPIADLLLEDLDKQTVKFAPNFDDSETEPTVLPSYFPNILANGAAGIAAGYATNMPPHNLGELIDAAIKLIETPKARLETILNIVQGPDFPTGGIVQGRDGIREAFATGRGKVVINSRWHFESNDLVIDEIPYEIIKQDLVKKIGDVVDANPGLGIGEIRDETDRTGLRIVIELDAKANGEVVRKFLFKNTPLSVSYSYNNVVIVDKQPKLLGIVPILQAYIEHYRNVMVRKTTFEFEKGKRRLEIVRGLIKMVDLLDQVIRVIRKSENRATAIENLANTKYGFSILQATAIVDMRLHRLTSTDIVKLKKEERELEKILKHLRKILHDEMAMNQEIIGRLRQVKRQFAIPRRTSINEFEENLEVAIKDTLVERRFSLWVSRDGYIKAMDSCFIERNDSATFGRKPFDLWISHGEVSNLDNLLLVTNKGNYYSVPLYKVPMSKWKDLGVHLNSIVTMSESEKILGVFVIHDFAKATQQILLATKNGQIKRTTIICLETKIFNKSFKIMKFEGDDELVAVGLVTSKTHSVLIGTEGGYNVVYDMEDVPIQGTIAKGVKATSLKTDKIAYAWPMDRGDELIFFTNQNQVKKVKTTEIPISIRPKRGLNLLSKTSKDDKVKLGFVLKEYDQIVLLNEQNQLLTHKMAETNLSPLDGNLQSFEFGPLLDGACTKLLTSLACDEPAPALPVSEEEAAESIPTPVNESTTKPLLKTKKVAISKTKGNKVAKKPSSTDLGNLLGDISGVLSKKARPKTASKKIKNSKNVEDKQLTFDDNWDAADSTLDHND